MTAPDTGEKGSPITAQLEEEPTPASNGCNTAPEKNWRTYSHSPYLSSHSNQERPLRSNQYEEEGLLSSICAWIVQHQIGLSVNLLLLLTLTHLSFARARPITLKFFTLSYHDPTTSSYAQGWDDLCLVTFLVVVFTGLRAVLIDHVLKPFASWRGIGKPKARAGFAEQAWLLLYCTLFWNLGMSIMYHSAYWFSLRELWSNFPSPSMNRTFKWYYLAQFAFWIQQMILVNIEERRREYWQTSTHHIITSALIFTSYCYYQTKAGNVVLCLMEAADLLLALAKVLKYLGHQAACDAVFASFIPTWFMLRHVGYLILCWSIFAIVPHEMHYGCYSSASGARLSSDGGSEVLSHLLQPFRDPGGTICFNERIRFTFLALLLALQGLNLMWFGTIVRVTYQVLTGATADETKIDERAEVDDEVEERRAKLERSPDRDFAKPIEDEVGVEGLHFNKRPSPARQFRKSGGRTSGISIPGHSDRKELLGRIGCDKPS